MFGASELTFAPLGHLDQAVQIRPPRVRVAIRVRRAVAHRPGRRRPKDAEVSAKTTHPRALLWRGSRPVVTHGLAPSAPARTPGTTGGNATSTCEASARAESQQPGH